MATPKDNKDKSKETAADAAVATADAAGTTLGDVLPTPAPAPVEEPPPLTPAVPKRETMMFRTALDLLPGWVGAFKDDFAKKDPGRPPTDDEIAASIIAGVESFKDKDAEWRAIHP